MQGSISARMEQRTSTRSWRGFLLGGRAGAGVEAVVLDENALTSLGLGISDDFVDFGGLVVEIGSAAAL